MNQRIIVLIRYFLQTLFTSLPGSIYIILTLAYWILLFNPSQGTPHIDYFILVAGAFGPIAVFLITLTITARANQAVNYPLVVRLPSRVEYLTAVLFSSLLATFALQLLLSILALVFRGPDLTLARLIEIPPIWLAPTILSAIVALHASDLVTSGWSRIYVFGVLAVFLFGQSFKNENLTRMLNSLSRYATNQEWYDLSTTFNEWANSLSNSDTNILGQFFGFLFWPFQAISDATINGYFTATQALAPAIILLYATILFLLAADLFSNKDLTFTE
ncbi:MAG: hypothetical protein DWQ04_03575 [Chloroflexi bacterium]|nr:MAG: hypothetical protein DWQ04_03575 [Chloroflexota bacterium]